MTTIAYKDGWLACDSLVTCGDHAVEYAPKMHKVGGVVFAHAGDMFAGYRIRDFLRGGGDIHDLKIPEIKRQDFVCLVFGGGNLYYLNSDLYLQKINSCKPYAVGSGEQFALGAMYAGASAEEAVKIASKMDIRTGGRVQKINLFTYKW